MQLSDSTAVLAYRADPEVVRFQTWRPISEEEVRRFIRNLQGLVPGIPGHWYQFALIRQSDGALLGDCGVHVPLERIDVAELGLTLAQPYQGQGYATEILRAMIEFCFGTLQLRTVLARTAKQNMKSIALIARCGITPACPEEYGMVEDSDELFFSLDRGDWEKLRSVAVETGADR
jgi:RimJ/RimL family protein N-acetyltransferase